MPNYDYLVGADVGYRISAGSLYLAFVLGAAVGVGLEEDDGIAGPLLPLYPRSIIATHPFVTNDGRRTRPVLAINPELIRIGWVF